MIQDASFPMDQESYDQEIQHFFSVLSNFKAYKSQSLLRVDRSEAHLSQLPQSHQVWLSTYKKDLEKIKLCVDQNADVISTIIKDSHHIMAGDDCSNAHSNNVGPLALAEGVEKVQCVLKQLMRDWSSLGAQERQQCYQPIIDELVQQFPEGEWDRAQTKVLVPGAGLGRLAFEIASLNFICQGNEFSMYMLIVSFFVLNCCQQVEEFLLYPWIHHFLNNLSVRDQMLSIRFPDVRPKFKTANDSFSMTAGDFLQVYQKADEWNCVATCFFIDCASNVVAFVETIYKILVPGGVWINLGPLLYHYSDMKYRESIEPSFEVLCEVIRKVGFAMEKSQTGVKTRYCQNPKSMLQYEYESVFFVCRKPKPEETALI